MSQHPSAQWDIYFYHVNHKPALISLDLRAHSADRQALRPVVLWIFFNVLRPRDDGFPTTEEAKVIYPIEDAITQAAAALPDIQFVGRIATDGRQEMYFYGPRGSTLNAVANKAKDQFPAYSFESGSKIDGEWRHYRDVLFPMPRELQCMGNRDVLRSLQRNGDTLKELRPISHWAYFPSKAAAEAFASETADLGYKSFVLAPSATPPSQKPFGVRLSRIDSVQPPDIDRATLELFDLAQKHAGAYDGWESEAIRPTPTSQEIKPTQPPTP